MNDRGWQVTVADEGWFGSHRAMLKLQLDAQPDCRQAIYGYAALMLRSYAKHAATAELSVRFEREARWCEEQIGEGEP